MARQATKFDPRTLEIKTKSIERTLVPLVSQITTLVNHREKYYGKIKSEKTLKAIMKVGFCVQAAVERFVTVGESIADEHVEIQPEMYDACQEARSAGAAIASLSSKTISDFNNGSVVDRNFLVRATRQLLSSVTRVLLLADRVLVKQIICAEDKVVYTLSRLESTNNFTEFVKLFTQFGGEMVDLAHKTGDRQQDLKGEKRRAQMQMGRSILEKYTMLLLTSSKTTLRHPECDSARQVRNCVFRQIRSALQLIALCVCEGVYPYDPARYCASVRPEEEPFDIGLQLTADIAIKQFLDTLEMVRLTGNVGLGVQERIFGALNALCEMTQDFTDSAYTHHHHREQIIDFLGEIRTQLSNILQPEMGENGPIRPDDVDSLVVRISKVCNDLRKQLQLVALDQATDVFRSDEDEVITSSIKACSVSGDVDGVEQFIERFRDHANHMEEVCRLLHHISLTESLHVRTGHSERNLRALAPLTILSGRTFCLHPSSRIARENLQVFCETWSLAINELARLAKEVDVACHGRQVAEKQSYMSLPKPGKHGSTAKPVLKATVLDTEEQQKIAKLGLEMKLLTSEVDAEAEKWDEYAENDIVKRAKSMSSMAYNMYLFTRGDGPLKTTHDLFTQAEFFAEEANKMYRNVREFCYEVPGSAEKNELLQTLERIPTHCQQLQVLVKSPTVGKLATFNKVDSVIQETKNLMNEIAKLVTSCFVCATKFEIEFRSGAISSSRLLLSDGTDYDTHRSGDSSPWRRTPSVRRSRSQPRVTDQSS
ncbi:Alpha-catulin [Trichinella pseudospiralis]|uniref:Alpha-catulin n=2 Tax=Trichinella pseudospiralis TaxID=6337 RepID=A0A0V0XL88_TRIPS|nr:Alpha-catulin [Trichinella pseudospiralis]KRY72237.1 Alpha-catulin [Trichinella pseudospiralis]KRY84312.1 Alpha-catulin [Trichinella pseudospiralis]KRZ18248.1 Alpha-catulin [Trichinella pseudospiralis]KRZ42850.1 Alpha-catulin [Trichinella pseudospiralis]